MEKILSEIRLLILGYLAKETVNFENLLNSNTLENESEKKILEKSFSRHVIICGKYLEMIHNYGEPTTYNMPMNRKTEIKRLSLSYHIEKMLIMGTRDMLKMVNFNFICC